MSKPEQKNKICRVCLDPQNSRKLSIFSTLESISILYALENISDLRDLRFDGFTKFVCQPCAENVVAAYKIKIQCLSSDAFLRGVVDSQNDLEESETETQEDDQQIKQEIVSDPILIVQPDTYKHEDNAVEDENESNQAGKVESDFFKEDNVLELEIIDDQGSNVESDSLNEERIDDDNLIDEKDISGLYSSDPEESVAEDDEFGDTEMSLVQNKSGRKSSMNSLYIRSCCQCLDTFETESELIVHFKAIHAQCITQQIELRPDVSQLQNKAQCILCHKSVRKIITHRRRKHFKDYQDDSTVLGRKPNKLYLRSCCQCPKLFDDEKEVIDHFAVAHAERVKHNFKSLLANGNQKQCILCYKLVRNIHTHRRRMHSKDYQARVDQDGNWAFTCDICDIKFNTQNKLNNHNKHNHEGSSNIVPCSQDITVCPLCGLEANSPSLLDKHLMIEHPDSKCIECKVCNKMLKLATSLKKHLMTHNVEIFECKHCQGVFLTREDLDEHEFLHSLGEGEEKLVVTQPPQPAPKPLKTEIIIDSRYQGNGDSKGANTKKAQKDAKKKHFCCKCKDIFDSEEEVGKHFHKVHPDKVRFQYDDVFARPEGNVQCTLCLGYVKDLYRHRRTKHDSSSYVPKRDFQCTNCGKIYRTDRALKECERKHLGLPLERLQCPQCPVTLANRMNLIGHMKLHSKFYRYECELCGRQFKKGTNLKKHLMSTHSDERTVRCDVCGKMMKTKSSLSMHMRIHTGERPYQCSYCSNTYMHPTDLKRHEMVHTGFRPHRCDVCDKGFIKKSSLVDHQKTHVL